MIRTNVAAPRAVRPGYSLRGKYAARRTFDVPAELMLRKAPEPPKSVEVPRWFSAASFATISTVMLFCMCMVGRAGA